nr:MAG: DNA pilot protein [Microvirus sp.]
MSSGGNIISTAMANRSNKELAQYAYSKDLEMWEKNNLYNAPTQQMERLRAAGLNPNLVYGNGTVTGNTSGQTPQFKAPDIKSAKIDPIQLTQFQDLKLREAQTSNTQAATDNTVQATANAKLDGISKVLQNRGTKVDTELKEELQKTQADIVRQTLSNTKATGKNLEEQTKLMQLQQKAQSFGLKLSQAQLKLTLENIKAAESDNSYREVGLDNAGAFNILRMPYKLFMKYLNGD